MKKILLILMLIMHSFWVNAQTDCSPVIKLKSLYTTDNHFKHLIDSMFANVQPLPDGSQNFWKGKNINNLYAFVNKWFYTLPAVSDGLGSIAQFSLLYYHNPYGLQFVTEEPGLSWTLYFVKEQGKFMDSPQSTATIPQWLAESSLHNNDYIIPTNGFKSFNEFFTRSLKERTRPIADANNSSIIVSPVDGMINWIRVDLKRDSILPVKGRMKLNITQLLDSSKFVNYFIDGTAVSLILLPKNYHHFHSPVAGELVESKEHVGKILFGSQMMDFFMKGTIDFSVFENYKHGYFIIQTKQYGYVAVIPVGLETVGSVVFENSVKNISADKKVPVAKGERLGHFAYGGSMVMLLFEKNRMKPYPVHQESPNVQQGQQIGIFVNK